MVATSGRSSGEADRQELAILEEDEQLLCYPSLIRLDPARRAVLIDRKPYRHVRPRVLVNHLKAQQERQTEVQAGPVLGSTFHGFGSTQEKPTRAARPHLQMFRSTRSTACSQLCSVAPGEYSKQEFLPGTYISSRRVGNEPPRRGRLSISPARRGQGRREARPRW